MNINGLFGLKGMGVEQGKVIRERQGKEVIYVCCMKV